MKIQNRMSSRESRHFEKTNEPSHTPSSDEETKQNVLKRIRRHFEETDGSSHTPSSDKETEKNVFKRTIEQFEKTDENRPHLELR